MLRNIKMFFWNALKKQNDKTNESDIKKDWVEDYYEQSTKDMREQLDEEWEKIENYEKRYYLPYIKITDGLYRPKHIGNLDKSIKWVLDEIKSTNEDSFSKHLIYSELGRFINPFNYVFYNAVDGEYIVISHPRPLHKSIKYEHMNIIFEIDKLEDLKHNDILAYYDLKNKIWDALGLHPTFELHHKIEIPFLSYEMSIIRDLTECPDFNYKKYGWFKPMMDIAKRHLIEQDFDYAKYRLKKVIRWLEEKLTGPDFMYLFVK